MTKQIALIFLGLLLILQGSAQGTIVDQVVGIVGKTVILQSEVEMQYLELTRQGIRGKNMKCRLFEDILMQKLLLNQAMLDSIEANPAQVELTLEQKLSYFEDQAGSREDLLKYFNKSSRLEIKDDMRESIRDQMIIQQMHSLITGSISMTPSETRKYFKSLPEDSIPFIEAGLEVSQIVLYPSYGEEAVVEVRRKLLDLRKRIVDGEKFSTLARLYSQGPSAIKGGDIGCMAKVELDPEYAKAAFGLKEGNVSNIVKSQFGYHIIQLYERQDKKVCTRHILMRPSINDNAIEKALNKLDSVSTLIRLDSLTFDEAALQFSEDENTSTNGGLLINPNDGSSIFKVEDLPEKDYRVIRNLKIGEISQPFQSMDEASQTVFKIVQLRKKIPAHKANLKDDYHYIKEMAKASKQQEILMKWKKEKQEDTYIKINEPFNHCNFMSNGWLKNQQ